VLQVGLLYVTVGQVHSLCLVYVTVGQSGCGSEPFSVNCIL